MRWPPPILAFLLLASPVCAQFTTDVCDAQERALYRESVHDAVVANWKVPYDDRYIACTLLLSLNWRGEVLNVGIANCGEDRRVHRSVVDAGYSASPLRMPENKACFERSVIVRIEFRPLAFDDRGESVDPE
jgi:hypothetical protein